MDAPLWSLPDVADVPVEFRHCWEMFLYERNEVFSGHFFCDENYLTNANGCFHSLYVGSYPGHPELYRRPIQIYEASSPPISPVLNLLGGSTHAFKRFAYIGPLIEFPAYYGLKKHLSETPRYAATLVDANDFKTVFYISGSAETIDEGHNPTITELERLCEVDDITGLDRYELKQRMREAVGLSNERVDFFYFHDPNARQGTRPRPCHRHDIESSGSFFFDASLLLDPEPEPEQGFVERLSYDPVPIPVPDGPVLQFMDWVRDWPFQNRGMVESRTRRDVLRFVLNLDPRLDWAQMDSSYRYTLREWLRGGRSRRSRLDSNLDYRLEFPGQITTITANEGHLVQEPACHICSAQLLARDEVDQLPCGHFFHPQCAGHWHIDEIRLTCPVCHPRSPEDPCPPLPRHLRPPPPPPTIVGASTVAVYGELLAQEQACPICYEELSIDEKVEQLPCSHFFHHPCIMNWVSGNSRKATCPSCRRKLVVKNIKSGHTYDRHDLWDEERWDGDEDHWFDDSEDDSYDEEDSYDEDGEDEVEDTIASPTFSRVERPLPIPDEPWMSFNPHHRFPVTERFQRFYPPVDERNFCALCHSLFSLGETVVCLCCRSYHQQQHFHEQRLAPYIMRYGEVTPICTYRGCHEPIPEETVRFVMDEFEGNLP